MQIFLSKTRTRVPEAAYFSAFQSDSGKRDKIILSVIIDPAIEANHEFQPPSDPSYPQNLRQHGCGS